MVAVMTGLGLGVERGSGFVLGSRGQLGTSSSGRFGENVTINGATGNLAITRTDEILLGLGPDANLGRSYNSLGAFTDDNGDNWQLDASRRVAGLTGTVNTTGSTIIRYDWDGSETLYTWDAARSAYVGKQGAGSYDILTFASNVWTFTDGNSRAVERYDALNGGRLTRRDDADGNQLNYTYTGTLLTRVATSSGERVDFSYSGNNMTQMVTTLASTATLTRVRYTYDASNRLSTVTTDLTPGDNSISDGATVVTTYTYDGTSKRVASISESGSSSFVSFAYTQVGSDYRISTVTETGSDAGTRVTSFSYDTTNRVTTVTDALGKATQLTYDSSGNLIQIKYPPAVSGAAQQVVQYAYNANGDVTSMTDAGGKVVTYSYDANGNLTQETDAAGNTVDRTYGSKNELLNEIHYLTPASGSGGSGGGSTTLVPTGPNLLVNGSFEQMTGTITTDWWGRGSQTIPGWTKANSSRFEESNSGTQGVTATDGSYWLEMDGDGSAGTNMDISQTVGGLTAGQVMQLQFDHANFADAASGPFAVYWNGTLLAQFNNVGTAMQAETFQVTAVAGNNTLRFLALGTADGIGAALDNVRLFATTTASAPPPPPTGTNLLVNGSFEQISGTVTNDWWGRGSQTIPGWTKTNASRFEEANSGTQNVTATDGSYWLELDGDGGTGTNMDISQTVGGLTAGQVMQLQFDHANFADAASGPFAVYWNGTLVDQINYVGTTMQAKSYQLTAVAGNNVLRFVGLGTADGYGAGIDNVRLFATAAGGGGGGGSGTAAATPVVNRYVYDGENHLRFVIDAEGYVTEYRYDTPGQLISTIKYTSVAYDISSLAASASPSEATLTTWAAGLSATDKSLVQRTDVTYDFRGNIATTREFSAADSAGAGLTTSPYTTTTYVYDQFGLLLSRQVSGITGLQTYTYDGLGRMLTATDFAGATTTTAFNNGTRTTTVTLANGLVKTSVYTAQGELASYAESGSDIATETENYKYDKLGRLRFVGNALGQRDFIFYDDAGRKTGYMDRNGALTEYRYDAANRLVATIKYANALSSTAIASLYDANGNPTTVAIASVRPAASDFSDHWTWNIYDNADRLIETITAVDGASQNPFGSVTTYSYDGDSRLIQTTQYANLLSQAVIAGYKTTAPAAAVLPTANAATDRSTRIFYDNAGRKLGVLDSTGALSRTVYDKAGRVIDSVGYAGFVTAGLRAAGTWSQLVADVTTVANPADRHSYVVYDGRGDVRYTLDANARPTEYVYDNAGNVIRIVEYGASVTPAPSYSASYVSGQITSLSLATNAATRTSRFVYDGAGRKAFQIDAEGYVVANGYSTIGQVIKQTRYLTKYATSGDPTLSAMQSWATTNANAADRVERQVFNMLGLLAYEVDAEGFVTEHQYDLDDRRIKDIRYPSKYTIADGVTKTSLATQIGALPAGAVVKTYAYDAADNLIDSWDGENVRTHYVYNAFGQTTQISLAYGTADVATTAFTYDAAGRTLTTQTAFGTADAATTTYAYDGLSNITAVTNARGFTTTRTYDGIGNIITETVPLEGTTTAVTARQYDAFGNVVKLTDPRGNAGYFYYDTLGRLTLQIDAEGYATKTAYNNGDQPISTTRYYAKPTGTGSVTTQPTLTTDPKDATTTFSRDKLDRVTATTDAQGFSESYVLNAFGDRTQVTNKLGGVTTNTFDKRGLLISETLPVGSYLSNGNQQAGGNITNTFAYDARGNRTQMVEASNMTEKRTTNYTYDKRNQLLTKAGDAITVLNPTTMATSSVTPTESYSYDARGNLIQTTDATGARTLAYYDANDRKIATVNAVGALSTSVYDLNGNVTATRTYGDSIALPASPGGTRPNPVDATKYREALFAYDKNDRQITSTIVLVRPNVYLTMGSYVAGTYTTANLNAVSQNIYDAAGNVIQQIDANGNSIYSYFDKNGRKTAQIDQSKYLTNWSFDSEGNVLTETRYANAVVGTVTSATIPSAVADAINDRGTTFTYDKNGRRLTETRLNVLASTVSGNSVTTSSVSATITYTYNGLGEVLSKAEATGDTTTYGYDVAGRQTSVTGPSFTDYTGATVTPQQLLSYNGLNNVSRSAQNGSRITTFSYDASGNMSASVDPSNQTTNYYYDAAKRLVATTYDRVKSDGTTIRDGRSTAYDAVGRVTAQRIFSFISGAWSSSGDTTEMFYNSYGDVVAKGTNSGGNIANAQEFADYDNAGRAWRTNFNDGVTKAYVYDANGNATLLFQTTGSVNLRNLATLDAIFADSSGAITQTFSVFGARNNLIDTIQVQSNNAGANPVHAVQVTDTGDGGQYFNGSIGVNSSANYAATGATGSVSGTPGSLAANRSTTLTAAYVNRSFIEDGGPYSFSATDKLTISTGNSARFGGGLIHIILVNSGGTTEIGTMTADSSSKVMGYTNNHSTTTPWAPPIKSGTNTVYLYQEAPDLTTRILLGQVSFNWAGEETVSGSSTVSGKIQFQAQNAGTSKVLMFARPQSSSGPYQVVGTTQLTNSTGGAIAGWFTADPVAAPFNGLPANSAWDIRYYAMDAAGNTLYSQTATLSTDASAAPSLSSIVAQPKGGPGRAILTREGPTDYLIASERPAGTQSVRIRYRIAGSGSAWSSGQVSSGGYGQAGVWALNVTGWGGPYEYWLEDYSGASFSGSLLGKSYGTFSVGSQPSALTAYSDLPETVIFTPPSGTTVTSQKFRYYSGGVWSSWITYGAAGVWNYDAAALVPDRYGSYSYPVQYETYNGTTLVSHTETTLSLGYNNQGVSTLVQAASTPAMVEFTPQQTTATKMVLWWRDLGSTGTFTTTTILKTSAGFAWDVDAAPAVRPSSGSRTLEFYYDAYDASNNLLPTQNGADHAQGKIVIQSDRYATTMDTEIRWVIDTKAVTQYLIDRKQSFNAFGEISSETDGRGNITTFAYNTEGKLIKKTGALVSVTDENGNTTSQNPIEQYYYDKAGRLVGQRDANGNLTTQVLLAGTGYGGSEATAIAEYRPASSTTQYGVDVFGNVRKVTDPLGAVTLNYYDNSDRLIEVDHATRVGGNSAGVQLKDYYAYDILGQRTKHWNSQLGAGVVETADYDAQGRVTSTKSLAGLTTSYAYSYLTTAQLATTGLGSFGGWQTTTTNSAGLTSIDKKDLFGHLSWRRDFGNHETSYVYDLAGHLINQNGTSGQSVDYAYYANGYIKSITDNVLHMKSTFEYDNDGNRTLETYNSTDTYPKFYQNAAITYDAGNRITRFLDAKADITYKYDAVGNRRNVKSIYQDGVGGAVQTQDYWYKYDSANRFVLTMGRFDTSTNTIVTTAAPGNTDPNNAVLISYDAAGNRATATYGSDGHTETYSYTADGYLENMSIGGTVRARRTYDGMGRVTGYSEYDTDGVTSVVSRSTTYDNDNRVLTDVSDTRVKHESDAGYDIVHNSQNYDYKAPVGSAYTGADQGVVTHVRNAEYRNGQTGQTTTTDTNYFYQWWDEAKQSTIKINASDPSNPNSGSWAPGFSNLTYDVNGHALKLTDTVSGRVVTFVSDAYGQVLVREEKTGSTLGPRQLYYYFNGNRIGDVGNNGVNPNQMDYAQTLARSGAGLSDPKSGFRYGKPVASADFDENYQPINAQYPGNAASLYTVGSGDTLRSIAQAAWGDSALWYLIADANGLSADTPLVAGQRLSIPNKVTNIHNNSGTFKVYSPGEAIGDTLPTLPAEPAFPPPPSKHGGCGVFGKILLIAVAVAVTIIALPAGPIAPTFGQGVLAGLAGSAASQGVGLATGLQSKLDFKGLALAGLTAGITAGVGPNGVFSSATSQTSLSGALGLGTIAGRAAEGLVGNALTQGIGVATGLQKRFDWTGVAAAGVAGGVSASIKLSSPIGKAVSGMAGGIAGAAATSLVTGNNFGDTLISQLPSIIGNTIGNMAADRIASIGRSRDGVITAQNSAMPRIPGQTDVMTDYPSPPLYVTVTDDGAEGHGLGWKIADTLGFHEGGFFYDLWNGSGSSLNPFDTAGIARTSLTSYDISLRAAFPTTLPNASYDLSGGYSFKSFSPMSAAQASDVAFWSSPGPMALGDVSYLRARTNGVPVQQAIAIQSFGNAIQDMMVGSIVSRGRLPGEVFAANEGASVPKGSANPATRAAASRGSTLHSDKPGMLPDQLRAQYPNTDFEFTKPGVAGQDVRVVRGDHPSTYGTSLWPNGVNYGDFKPGTPSGVKTFRYDQNNKWDDPTHYLPYDPITGKLLPH